jgi:hypothetical protein
LLVLLAGSCSPPEISMTEFAKLPPFKGKVAKVEKIPSRNPPRSVSGPDFRVTVIKADGSTLVISRIETYLWTALRLQQLLRKPQCDLPDEIVQCEDKHGQGMTNAAVQAIELLGQIRTNAVAPSEISEYLASWLMEWGLLGPEPRGEPEYTTMLLSVSNRIHAIRGYMESSGIHGDGTDWYEVELSPGIADQLRPSLKGASAFKKTRTVQFPCQEAAPSWWPTQWPRDVRLYEKQSSYFVLPESGTRAWYMRFRS